MVNGYVKKGSFERSNEPFECDGMPANPWCLCASVSLRHGTDTSAVVEIAESRSDRLSIGVGERLLERGLASLECA